MQAQALTDFMLPMLEYIPSRRATAAEMLRHPWLREADSASAAAAAATPEAVTAEAVGAADVDALRRLSR